MAPHYMKNKRLHGIGTEAQWRECYSLGDSNNDQNDTVPAAGRSQV